MIGCSTTQKNKQSGKGFRKYFKLDTPSANFYKIDKLGLTMEIPFNFSVVIEPKIQSGEIPEGLTWMVENRNMPLGHIATIELIYDKVDPLLQKYLNLDDYIEDNVIPELTSNDENVKLVLENLSVSGIPAQLVEIVNQYRNPKGTDQGKAQLMHIHDVVLIKDNQIFMWKFTVNELDYPEMDSTFHKFLTTIRFQ